VVISYRRFGTTYRSNLQGPRIWFILTSEDWTDRFYRNVGKKLPLLADPWRLDRQVLPKRR